MLPYRRCDLRDGTASMWTVMSFVAALIIAGTMVYAAYSVVLLASAASGGPPEPFDLGVNPTAIPVRRIR